MQTTIVPRGTTLRGAVESDGDLVVEGVVEGEISLGGMLTVAAGGTCRAQVSALAAVVQGELIGDLSCRETIEIEAGGRVVGELRAPEVNVAQAALIEGQVALGPPLPAQHEISRTPVIYRGAPLTRPTPPQTTSGSPREAAHPTRP